MWPEGGDSESVTSYQNETVEEEIPAFILSRALLSLIETHIRSGNVCIWCIVLVRGCIISECSYLCMPGKAARKTCFSTLTMTITT